MWMLQVAAKWLIALYVGTAMKTNSKSRAGLYMSVATAAITAAILGYLVWKTWKESF